MTSHSSSPSTLVKDASAPTNEAPKPAVGIKVALLTGGYDKPYVLGLAAALASRGVRLDVIGGDDVDSPELHTTPELNFLNLRENQQANVNLAKKVRRVWIYYIRLIRYATIAKPKIFHILWNNKFEIFDRTLLMLYYKVRRKKIALTVHNVNAGKRDLNDSPLNRLTLRIQYLLADHIFVHTEKMKHELLQDFGVCARAISVIPFGINNAVPETDLSPRQAKQRLGIKDNERTVLFFGAIRPYKGLEYLVEAFRQLAASSAKYRVIIAGQPKRGCERYLGEIQRRIDQNVTRERIIQRIQYIPDEEIELYFKAADILALPYTCIFQSGVLFLAYRFGLPVVGTDVGSLREEIIEGRTGYLCRPGDPVDLARAIEKYFESDLFKSLDRRRQEIQDYAKAHHSWDIVGEMSRNVYAELLGGGQS